MGREEMSSQPGGALSRPQELLAIEADLPKMTGADHSTSQRFRSYHPGNRMTSASSSSATETGWTQDDTSLASSNSSLLAEPLFAERFFVLKSSTVQDLKMCTQSGSWVPRAHNRHILAQACRNSQDNYIVLTANGSGVCFGRAKLLGPVMESPRLEASALKRRKPRHFRSLQMIATLARFP